MTDEYRYRVSMKCDTHGNIHGYLYCPECTIASLRAQLARVEKENKILEKVARGCLGTLFAETYLQELRALDAAKEGKG